MSKYQMPRSRRRGGKDKIGRMRGGQLVPVMAVRVRPSEGGMISQTLQLELDPIPGRMVTEIWGEMISVFVPLQAIDAILDPEAAYAGMTEVVRQKLLNDSLALMLEDENEISQRLKINPKSIGGVMKVSNFARLAYNAAVNHLRLEKYHKATLLPHTNTAVTPALLSSTILERLNGVLDPDDRINGIVNLELPTINLPVKGIGVNAAGASFNNGSITIKETGGTTQVETAAEVDVVVAQAGSTGFPDINAVFSGVQAGGVSLQDFYNAQTQDRLVRTMDKIIEDNPQYGYEMVLRWAHGLSIDSGHTPFVIAETMKPFSGGLVTAFDSAGVESEVMRSDRALSLSYTVPVPRTELGGVIVTMAVIRPDETIASMPDPDFTEPWELDNFVADELALDPVPVTLRELDTNCGAGNEATVAFYTGLNALRQAYQDYGLARYLDPNDIENKTVFWQLEIPLSVTPDNILYPSYLPHYPFPFSGTELAPEDVCTYRIKSNFMLPTPMIFGPTPVEDIDVIDAENLFEQEV